MTRISEIHGIKGNIPADEYNGRAALIAGTGYVPYLSLTKGEMELYLAAQRAKVRAQWYGSDDPRYQEAFQMIENALHQGVHGGVKFMGAVPDYLQNVARMITKAQKETTPASKSLYFRQAGVSGIGQTVIPIEERRAACVKEAMKLGKPGDRIRAIKECERIFQVEKIFNDRIESAGHHVLYHRIDQKFQMPDRVYTKLLLQISGVQGMAGAATIDNSLMASWVDTGILKKNAATSSIGPIDSLKSSFELSDDPQMWADKYAARFKNKKDKTGGIGLGPLGVALIPVIVAALTAAVKLAENLLQQNVLIKAQGFGTDAYSANQYDWKVGADNPETSGGLDTNTLLLAGGAAALFLLLGDDN